MKLSTVNFSAVTGMLFLKMCSAVGFADATHADVNAVEHATQFDDVANTSERYRVLVLTPFCSKSHIIAYAPLLNELVARGHSVTAMVSYPVANIDPAVEILTDEELQKAAWGIFQYQFPEYIGTLRQAVVDELAFAEFAIEGCRTLLKTPTVQKLKARAKPGSFDFVLMTSHMTNECMFGFVNRIKAPFGYIFSAGDQPWSSGAVGNPFPTSFVPYIGSPFGDRMSFWERLVNTALALAMNYNRQRIYSTVEPWVREEFELSESDPSIAELETNVSLVLLNQDSRLFQYPAPTLPNMIAIGGAHCRAPRPLPAELRSWVEDGLDDEGLVFFSMGSAVAADNFPDAKRKMFADAFARIRAKFGVKVLWKWDGVIDEALAADPRGFKVQKWVPQQDVLGHKKCKLFITHGGLLSSQETTYHGVPILGIPVGADQMLNLKRMADWGAGRMLLWGEISTDRLVAEISEILSNPSYSEKARERSAIMKDQLNTPEELGSYWIEYVIRHGGAPHLRSHGRLLTWWQYHLIDVWAFILLILSSVAIVFWIGLRFVIRCLRPADRASQPQNVSGKQKDQ